MDTAKGLSRFVIAQERDFETALKEIKDGRKRSHWMWYIFPQIKGLGRSSTAEFYAIKDINEAREFLNHPYLGKNLIEICNALLELRNNNPTLIMGTPDDLKLKSSMTLFLFADDQNDIFQKVLDKFYSGGIDYLTKEILGV